MKTLELTREMWEALCERLSRPANPMTVTFQYTSNDGQTGKMSDGLPLRQISLVAADHG